MSRLRFITLVPQKPMTREIFFFSDAERGMAMARWISQLARAEGAIKLCTTRADCTGGWAVRGLLARRLPTAPEAKEVRNDRN